MQILFLCVGVNPWRVLIAKKVLKTIDEELDIYAAQLNEDIMLGEKLKNNMREFGFTEDDFEIHFYSQLQNVNFDYMITLSGGTKDALKRLPKNYKQKLHLEFSSQKDLATDDVNSLKVLKKIRSEFEGELDYFYHRILKRKAAE